MSVDICPLDDKEIYSSRLSRDIKLHYLAAIGEMRHPMLGVEFPHSPVSPGNLECGEV